MKVHNSPSTIHNSLFSSPPPHYQSYLLRGIETRSEELDETAVWRFSLQDPQTGAERRFPDLDALLAHLRDVFNVGS